MGFFGRLFDRIFGGGASYSDEQLRGLGYKSDGRGTREKIKKGSQKVLLDSTKLLLDRDLDDSSSPYEAGLRVDNNVYQMFNDDISGQQKRNK